MDRMTEERSNRRGCVWHLGNHLLIHSKEGHIAIARNSSINSAWAKTPLFDQTINAFNGRGRLTYGFGSAGFAITRSLYRSASSLAASHAAHRFGAAVCSASKAFLYA